nr:hypothetical protein CFP56_51541 [Quercus suber]
MAWKRSFLCVRTEKRKRCSSSFDLTPAQIQIQAVLLGVNLMLLKLQLLLVLLRKTWVLDQIYIRNKVILMTQKLKTIQ